ncbi:uncharacterized protein BCR38DRAFT_408505 [Pseudomassariella vexata]|uniref:Uncharacterized protein n=1 Tax=Pseudomassariella vexata TaxID=1141098 RepID=A0A1Y2E6U5_9PEZI|nr:uncharacterized protein BCR38DRAFT_408505 [Pseudomassariella vexata]ORY66585.1 hypothetical protein BCR38DRAFT_408505 [Pseudomassariella vexata]
MDNNNPGAGSEGAERAQEEDRGRELYDPLNQTCEELFGVRVPDGEYPEHWPDNQITGIPGFVDTGIAMSRHDLARHYSQRRQRISSNLSTSGGSYAVVHSSNTRRGSHWPDLHLSSNGFPGGNYNTGSYFPGSQNLGYPVQGGLWIGAQQPFALDTQAAAQYHNPLYSLTQLQASQQQWNQSSSGQNELDDDVSCSYCCRKKEKMYISDRWARMREQSST